MRATRPSGRRWVEWLVDAAQTRRNGTTVRVELIAWSSSRGGERGGIGLDENRGGLVDRGAVQEGAGRDEDVEEAVLVGADLCRRGDGPRGADRRCT